MKDETDSLYSQKTGGLVRPAGKRKEINLCGLMNQGATCYLNSLIQTLFLTREFRENLFSLSGAEIGATPSPNNVKQRVILIELQRLFAELLELDQESCSTNRLTDSFGWTNNEEMQQHDVQELNRILFSAIESSLVNTRQAKLIQELYRGTYVNKVRCLTCLNVFQREEEFLDLPVIVQGSSGLEMSLINSYLMRENLNGNNQYKCEKCNNQYRDAERYCQLKTLPPILTFSLLRFTYDLKTYQRIKETERFEFPFEIDLREFMEDTSKTQLAPDYTKYELYSVIIHSGSAYGGHYHCYIKDMDNISEWSMQQMKFKKEIDNPEVTTTIKREEETCENELNLIYCDEDGEPAFSEDSKEIVNLDYLKYEQPLDLLKAFIYNKHKYDEVKVEAICADLTKVTGTSWNKRFKGKYGSIEKFLRKYDDTFELSEDKRNVRLKPHRVNILASSMHSQPVGKKVEEAKKGEETSQVLEDDGDQVDEEYEREKCMKYHWYDFDDSKVTPIYSSKIQSQFEGKESAYMLFYRRVSTKNSSPKTKTCHKIPEWLKSGVQAENRRLNEIRKDYENKMNTVELEIYLGSDFYLEQDVLNSQPNTENKMLSIEIDKRNTTVKQLKEILVTLCTETNSKKDNNEELQSRKETFLNLLFGEGQTHWLLASRVDTSATSAGRFAYFISSVLDEPDANVFSLISANKNNAKKVLVLSEHRHLWPVGDRFEPVRIVAKFFDQNFMIREVSFTFAKCAFIHSVKETITKSIYSSKTKPNSLNFSLMRNKFSKTGDGLKTPVEDHKTLSDYDVKNGDFLMIETDLPVEELFDDLTPIINEKPNPNRQIRVFNCLSQFACSKDIIDQKVELSVDETILVSQIRSLTLAYNLDVRKLDLAESHLRLVQEDDIQSENDWMLQLLSRDRNNQHLSYPGICLHDDIPFEEVLKSVKSLSPGESLDQKVVFLLCPGRAPRRNNNEIVLRFKPETSRLDFSELVFADCRVVDLTHDMVKHLNLKPIEAGDDEQYYLKSVNFFGDPENTLNDINLKIADVPLKHNDSLLIARGKLVPRNHLKICVWWISSSLSQKMDQLSTGNEEISVNDLMERKSQEFKLLDEMIVRNEMRLEDLRVSVQSLLLDRSDCVECENIRMRVLKRVGDQEPRFQMKKGLFEWHKTLKQLGLSQESDICVQIMAEDDSQLNQGVVLLDCVRLSLKSRQCEKSSFKQMLWNVNNGATLHSLKESILKAYELPAGDLFKMSVAKRLIEKCNWILLKESAPSLDSTNTGLTQSKKGKKKSFGASSSANKTNLKAAPFYLDDGDLVAFTLDSPEDNSPVSKESFMSHEDLEYAKKLNITAAEIARLRKERKANSDPLGLGAAKRNNRRAEVGITIKIDDFNS